MRFLYALIFPNGKRYIGVSNDVARRWADHRKTARRPSAHPLYSAIRKYGADSVVVQTLVCGSVEYIADMEVRAIAVFGTMDLTNGYNISPGGGVHSDASRDKISASKKGRSPSAETRAKMSAAKRAYCDSPEGKAAWAARREQTVARLQTPAARAKAAASKRGKKHSPEWVERSAAKRRGQKRSPEARERMRAAALRRLAGMNSKSAGRS